MTETWQLDLLQTNLAKSIWYCFQESPEKNAFCDTQRDSVGLECCTGSKTGEKSGVLRASPDLNAPGANTRKYICEKHIPKQLEDAGKFGRTVTHHCLNSLMTVWQKDFFPCYLRSRFREAKYQVIQVEMKEVGFNPHLPYTVSSIHPDPLLMLPLLHTLLDCGIQIAGALEMRQGRRR